MSQSFDAKAVISRLFAPGPEVPAHIANSYKDHFDSSLLRFSALAYLFGEANRAFSSSAIPGILQHGGAATQALLHPLVRNTLRLGSLYAVYKDMKNRYSKLRDAGFEKSVAWSQTYARGLFHAVNSFAVPLAIFRAATAVCRKMNYRGVGLPFALGFGLTGLYVSATDDTVNGYFAISSLDRIASKAKYNPKHSVGQTQDRLIPHNTDKFLPNLPNFMLLESAPLEEIPRALGETSIPWIHRVREWQKMPETLDILVPKEGVRGNTQIGEWALSTEAQLVADRARGWDDEPDVSTPEARAELLSKTIEDVLKFAEEDPSTEAVNEHFQKQKKGKHH